MITESELLMEGFEKSYLDDTEFYHKNNSTIRYTLDNGEIIFVRENDNFHGINLSGVDSLSGLFILNTLITGYR